MFVYTSSVYKKEKTKKNHDILEIGKITIIIAYCYSSI